MHHFSRMAPEAIAKSRDNLNPTVTSGPFLMAESKPSDHYTLVRNPRYYRAKDGLPYLDKLVFRIAGDEARDLQAGIIDSEPFVAVDQVPAYQRLTNYTLVAPPTSAAFEGLFFNFHNIVLASHLEVRQAIAMAIDQQALIKKAIYGFGSQLCTDHGSAMHPGYDPAAECQEFDPVAANKQLDDSGWVKGSDGVRTRQGQRLEFEYSTNTGFVYRFNIEKIVQNDLQAIGIKLDIQNYPSDTFFGSFLNGGKASPPTGAVAGRYDIAEFANGFSYDPDDSWMLSCDHFTPKGGNFDFYCNLALNALYNQELAAVDSGIRQSIFEQIHQIYLTQLPFIPLYSTNFISIVHKGTRNFQPSPFEGETINVAEWWCDHGKC